MANDTSNYPDYVFIAYDEDFSAQTHDVAVSLEASSLVGVPVKYVRQDLNTSPAAPVAGLETVGYRYRHVDYVSWIYGESKFPRANVHNEELVTRPQAEAIIAAKDADNAALTARVKELEAVYERLEQQALKDRKLRNEAQSDATLWQFDVARGSHPSLLVNVWKQRKYLEAKLAIVRKILEPFALEADNWIDTVPDSHRSLCTEPGSKTAHPGSETAFTVGDLRAARAALEAKP